jgi:hypothetical protein
MDFDGVDLGRGFITALTGVSVNSTLWMSSFSVSLKMPLAAPSRINDLTSSAEIKLALPASLPPNSLSTRLLDPVSSLTKIALECASSSMGRATTQAICSENRKARDLGTSSPSTSEKYEIGRTTMVSAMASAQRVVNAGNRRRSAAS